MRAFRLYDGPTEVHKYAIARQILRDPAETRA
jgi:acyl-CoA dehydrogenase